MTRNNQGQFVESDEFMKPQIRRGAGWIVETSSGTCFVPGTLVGSLPDVRDKETVHVKDRGRGPFFTRLAQFCGETPIEAEYRVKVWYGRYRAPGYLDATDWSWSDNHRSLQKELRGLYGDDDGGD